MRTTMLARPLFALALAALSFATALAAEVHVMISAGFYGVYAELGPAFERASGHSLRRPRRSCASSPRPRRRR